MISCCVQCDIATSVLRPDPQNPSTLTDLVLQLSMSLSPPSRCFKAKWMKGPRF